MCYLFGRRVSRAEYLAYYAARDDPASELAVDKDYVAAGGPGYVCRQVAGDRLLSTMRWGFPPPAGVRGPIVNVRNYASPFWRGALQEPGRRCLVPVTDFQEWSARPDPATGKRRPWWFSMPSRPIFSFAGIWRPTEAGPVFAFLTTGYDGDPSTHVVGAVHPKAIPVILHQEDEDRWLGAPLEEALQLACAFPSQLLVGRPG